MFTSFDPFSFSEFDEERKSKPCYQPSRDLGDGSSIVKTNQLFLFIAFLSFTHKVTNFSYLSCNSDFSEPVRIFFFFLTNKKL